MPSNPTPNPNTPPPNKPRRRPAPGVGGNFLWIIILALVIVWFMFYGTPTAPTIEWGDFIVLLNKHKLKKVMVGSDHITGEWDGSGTSDLPESVQKSLAKLHDSKKFTVDAFAWKIRRCCRGLQKEVEEKEMQLTQEPDHFAWLPQMVMLILPAVLLLGLFIFLLPRFRDPLGGGFLSNYIKSPAKRYERSSNRVTFDDVAGLQNAKGELQEVVEFLSDPEKFQRLGRRSAQGRFAGRPAGHRQDAAGPGRGRRGRRAVFQHRGSEFIQMFVGVGASRVRDMFKTAKENTPCILFIDEIDAVGRMRGRGRRRRLRRARADAQPDPQRDGRLHAQRKR